jgi:hypothetical protein
LRILMELSQDRDHRADAHHQWQATGCQIGTQFGQATQGEVDVLAVALWTF